MNQHGQLELIKKVLSSREVIDSDTFYVLTMTKTMSGPTYSRMTITF